MCAAPVGNRFWEARATHGRGKAFDSAEQLWKACVEYFEWVEANPLKEEKLFHHQGEIKRDTINKMRAMTLDGLCYFIGITLETWRMYRTDKDFSVVAREVDAIVREQKFAGAAADLLNANIIARDLGLKDATQTEHSGSIDLTGISDDELNARIAAHIAKP
jgi:hypothetical protein